MFPLGGAIPHRLQRCPQGVGFFGGLLVHQLSAFFRAVAAMAGGLLAHLVSATLVVARR